jgi:hypothetical protein
LNPFSQIELNERTLVSVLRTAIYVVMAILYGLTRNQSGTLLDGLVLGAVTADFLTWLGRSIVQLPENVSHGIYDGAVNVVFACFFFHFANFTIDDDGTRIMAVFTAFFVVFGCKMGYYGLQAVAAFAHE